MLESWELRARRVASGLTAKQVAALTGTSETNVAAYERGVKSPNAVTEQRLLTAIEGGTSHPAVTYGLLTAPGTAAAIRAGLRSGWPKADLLRLIRENRANSRHVRPGDPVFFGPPTTTGDARWDAFLAGSTENLLLRSHAAVPHWVAGHVLPTWWFFTDNPNYHAYAFAHSPASLKLRGVMIDAESLESV
jgi:transcriptional regulator with XRE-family HTH domain